MARPNGSTSGDGAGRKPRCIPFSLGPADALRASLLQRNMPFRAPESDNTSEDAPLSRTMTWPTEIRLPKDRKSLVVSFDTGEQFQLAAEYLRVKSPSAEVQGHSPS